MSGVSKLIIMTLILASRCTICGEAVSVNSTNHVCRISKDSKSLQKLQRLLEEEKRLKNATRNLQKP